MWQCGTVEDVGRESGELHAGMWDSGRCRVRVWRVACGRQCGTVEDVGRESGELHVGMWDSGRRRARVWRVACGNVGQWKM